MENPTETVSVSLTEKEIRELIEAVEEWLGVSDPLIKKLRDALEKFPHPRAT